MNLEVGSILTGKVTGIAKFGAFVALDGGGSGLVHISEVANAYINSVEEYLSVGQTVKVKVIAIDDAGRINLSIKQAEEKPQQEKTGGVGGQRNEHVRRPRQNAGIRREEENGRQESRNNAPLFQEEVLQKSDNQAFEASLKKFLQESDSKLSESGRYERQRSSRRRNGKR